MEKFCFGLMLVMLSVSVHAASKYEIDAKVEESLELFYQHSSAGKRLAKVAKGMLVFPQVIKAGFGIGGEYGEGKLIKSGQTGGYYRVASASIGFQLGVQVKSEVIMFMTQQALSDFENGDGWVVGVDGSVALVELGVAGELDSENIKDEVIAFIYSNKGLMYNLSLEGSKIFKIEK